MAGRDRLCLVAYQGATRQASRTYKKIKRRKQSKNQNSSPCHLMEKYQGLTFQEIKYILEQIKMINAPKLHLNAKRLACKHRELFLL